MQSNQSLWNLGFQSFPKAVLPPIPQIIGEGDVTAITFPDGSVQFYFVPTIKQNHLPCICSARNPYANLFPCPTNAEVWVVRSITHPQANLNISVPAGYFNSQLPPPYSPPNYFMNTNREYAQKFHNDKWTSTTDINYFYPSLRREKCLQYCTETQTEIPFLNNNIGEMDVASCQCESTSQQKPVNVECNCHPKFLYLV
ncbi:uncharacterized protein [Maniola hyperantus]|uniref:uncharacterized protein n=1 Tax=Aphantopus hyperantus TaxID=2795564 RepID=UPI001568A24D|nr:uncharacterized protein LOC117990310 [Maniola hyperantus]